MSSGPEVMVSEKVPTYLKNRFVSGDGPDTNGKDCWRGNFS